MNVSDIRKMLATAPQVGETIELIGVSFLADEPAILGEPNEDYITSELDWYLSQSLSVKDIKPFTPRIWDLVSSKDGLINSNYGFLFYSLANGSQYANVVKTLMADPDSRQAIAIYTRPTMHYDAFTNGMHDFVCTNTVQYLIRDGKLHVIVNMRSNDVVFGYRNDYAWQKYAQLDVANQLDVEPGDITWQVGSLHVYRRHWHLLSGLPVVYDVPDICADWTLDTSKPCPDDSHECILPTEHDGDHSNGKRTWDWTGSFTS